MTSKLFAFSEKKKLGRDVSANHDTHEFPSLSQIHLHVTAPLQNWPLTTIRRLNEKHITEIAEMQNKTVSLPPVNYGQHAPPPRMGICFVNDVEFACLRALNELKSMLVILV